MERLKVTNGTVPCLVNCNLHSSMERLKATEDFWPELENSDLHSSMERLKAAHKVFDYSMKGIYIPVWRD